MKDLISRQDAIDAVKSFWKAEVDAIPNDTDFETVTATCDLILKYNEAICKVLADVPSAQPERDIPMKPVETTDRAWGIPTRQAVCPKCDYYLGHIAFLDSYKGKRITYCETCGQAIDWEGWDFDE